jgi:hypothetical protein
MKPQDQTKFLEELRALCEENGLKLLEEHKTGSHVGLIIEDKTSDEKVSLVIADREAISPSTQRGILKFLTQQAVRLTIAEVVREIITEIFKI